MYMDGHGGGDYYYFTWLDLYPNFISAEAVGSGRGRVSSVKVDPKYRSEINASQSARSEALPSCSTGRRMICLNGTYLFPF